MNAYPAKAAILALFALSAQALTPALAHAAPQVTHAWSRPAVAGSTAAGFMTLTNPDKQADALVAIQSPLARSVEIHRSTMKAGVTSMQKFDRAPLPPGRSVTFAPGGHHLMFLGLTRNLKAGDRLPATLTFASGAQVSAVFEVRLAPPAAESHAHH